MCGGLDRYIDGCLSFKSHKTEPFFLLHNFVQSNRYLICNNEDLPKRIFPHSSDRFPSNFFLQRKSTKFYRLPKNDLINNHAWIIWISSMKDEGGYPQNIAINAGKFWFLKKKLHRYSFLHLNYCIIQFLHFWTWIEYKCL